MSEIGPNDVLKPLIMRSTTPAPNEKVLLYLEGMSREGDEPDNSPPRSMVDPAEYRSKAGSQAGLRSPQAIYPPAPRSKNGDSMLGSPINYANRQVYHQRGEGSIDGDDVDSNVQDGLRSENGDTMLPVREPGPHDPPGPKYESYDSGPSFGNFGPLPTDDHLGASGNPYAHSSWNPNWAQLMTKPTGGSWNQDPQTTLTDGGQAAYPNQPAKVPLPASEFASPRGNSMNINVESPSGPPQSQLPSQKSPSPSDRGVTSPKIPSRAQSRATNRGDDMRPLSPLSARSKVTRNENGTTYPPLPESRVGGETELETPMSPALKSRARSKAASISPSDSPSQTRTNQYSKAQYNGPSRSPPLGSVLSGGGHQSRPFSPYRHAPTTEDLMYAAARGRALAIPEEDERDQSLAQSKGGSAMSSNHNIGNGRVQSQISSAKQPSISPSKQSHTKTRDPDITPTPTRPQSPDHDRLDPVEARIVRDALARTPRTSYYAASLEPDIANHYHDMELCVLLHQEGDNNQHEVVRRALRKAVRQRIKKLGLKYDTESIRQYKKSYHDHDPSVHLKSDYQAEEPPKWAADLKREIMVMQQRIESLGPKIEGLKSQDRSFNAGASRFAYEGDDFTGTPMTQTVNIQTQPTGTLADSMYQPPETEIFMDGNDEDREFDGMTETPRRGHPTDGETRSPARSFLSEGRDDSPGQQYLEEELYKLRQKPSQSGLSHRTWEVARDDDDREEYSDTNGHRPAASGLPTIPDTNGETYQDHDRNLATERSSSPPLPALPDEEHQEMAVTPQGPWHAAEYRNDNGAQLPPWQRIHARLLSWAIIWPMSELDTALNSTTRGQQVDEVALSIWSTQTYKRYVRARLTDSPQGEVDRLFVPPNMADAISNAVFNGRHGDACGMLRDLWSPFGLEGMPRLLVVLAKHRSDPNHWVVHRFSLPDGALTTYDSYPERTLPDGRPLGWWFAIRVAWPNTKYPSPDHLMQKMVRLHRPMQLPIDNSVAAAGIWRNILMGSRAERSLDLERLRDLINTEVKNLRQRKQMGKLSIGTPRPTWEDMT